MKTELKKNEEIILETQQHWIVLVGPFIITSIFSLIGFAIGGYGVGISFFFICFFIYQIVKRKNNIWIVTNLRVIDEYGVLTNNSKESPLDKINNISFSQAILGRMLGYGNVQIQTAADLGSTTYYMVENPNELKDKITHLQEEYKNVQILKQATELANAIVSGNKNTKIDINSELEKLYELMEKGILTEDEYNSRKKKILNS
jgi:uncharacterized membrane protein YdbT with pleckstrin-like domain